MDMLDTIEERILGVLLEKEKTTPDYYPMTINGITTACNQKSSRNPVVSFTEEDVKLGIDGLRKKGIANTVTGGGAKTVKFKHNATNHYELEDKEEAILCLLLLRGPLTAGELKTNSARLFPFTGLIDVTTTIEEMLQKEEPLLLPLPKLSGQKEGRYIHLLGAEIDLDQYAEMGNESIAGVKSHYEERLEALESEVSSLEEIVDQLKVLLD